MDSTLTNLKGFVELF